MKRWKRKIFFILAIIIFLLVSPLAILYTSGYRYDFADKSLKKIGMIIVKSVPEEADVHLNDQYMTNKTPYKETSLFPDTYNIKITKEGYTTWEKNLTVESKLVTWISKARIFKLKPPTRILVEQPQIADYSLAPDYKKIVLTVPQEEGSELWLVNIDDLHQEKLFPLESIPVNQQKGSLSNIRWSPDSRKVLFNLTTGDNTHHWIVNTTKLTESIFLPNTNLQQLIWDTQDADFIYYLDNNNLTSVNLAQLNKTVVIAQNVVSYDLASRSIFYLKRELEGKGLAIFNITKNQNERDYEPSPISQLPGDNYILKVSPSEKLALLADNKSLFLSDGQEFKKLKDRVVDFDWTEKNDGLVFCTENEIWYYKVEKDEKLNSHPQYNLNQVNLFTRYSTKIDLAIWHPDEEHIIFATNNKLYIKELDSRDKANSAELAVDFPSDDQQKVWFDKKGQKIYHKSSLDKLDALVEKEIY
ncbi:PEGA domain-containing protein [Patescibacteria group bacterium]|nr:PEGA domain-containing protein [Patescibacteria group bacterium]